MENKPKDKSIREETNNPSNQPEKEQEKTKKEIDPNNPIAKQDKQDGAIQNNQHLQDKTNTSILNAREQVGNLSTPIEMTEKKNKNGNTQEREEEIREEAIIDGIHGVTESIKFDSEKKESNTESLYIKKGDL